MHQVYELNARTWRTERSQELGREATLDDLDYSFLDHLVESGFTWLYLFGVWRTGPLALAAACADESLLRQLKASLPDFSPTDIAGSATAVAGYEVAPDLGGDQALERLRARGRECGLSLMLDFVPNHVGLDHAWARERPELLVQGDQHQATSASGHWVRLHGRVFAHGRDPNFAPWRDTLQLDYGNPETHDAMIAQAIAIAGRCDGLRCEEAMLLLPDVFQGTWRRAMAPFWRRCIDGVRAEHPGTLFLAEVYWNKEWELQQQGFDFTYDKVLYDRLLTGEAESIRGHLRAATDYQNHSVRFVENDDEQRAAATFANPDHHRGALFLTGMVPGMLLCHYGQEDGRRLHSHHRCSRRAPEVGSEAHRKAYRELLQVLAEPARHDGSWQLLEPRGEHSRDLIACLWTHPGYHQLLLVVNAGWRHLTGAVDATPLANRDQQFQDFLAGGSPFTVGVDDLRQHGVRVDLPAWGALVYRIMSLR